MADFAALAKRLIDKNGRTITLVKQSEVPADPTKPWRGPSQTLTTLTAPDATVTAKKGFPIKAVFVNSETEMGRSFNELFDTTLKRQGESQFFAPASDADPELIEEFDSIIDGGQVWKITGVDILEPGDTRILYRIQVQR